MASVHSRVLPGFGLSLGTTVLYLCLIVLIPLSAAFLKTATLSWGQFWTTVSSAQALAAYALTFGASLAAAIANAGIGFVLAWVLVRYEFPGKRFFDALVDLPFALPTAVAGLVFASLYAKNGWLGQMLVPMGIEAAYSRLGIVLVLIFTGLPFVVRTLQPVLENLDAEIEEASASLGATRWQTFRWVIFPSLTPALLTGFALAFARSLGEYGSVVFIAGNIPYRTEIAPVLIVGKLEAFRYADATALAVVLLTFSFLLLGIINLLQRWSKAYGE
ncbi:MAG: sulfate ABC transporter permease subunit CysT [Planctomycetes bacterium]|nr:sulfate ABC transporter permease subunit CysT [Planctomycetota bacterium]